MCGCGAVESFGTESGVPPPDTHTHAHLTRPAPLSRQRERFFGKKMEIFYLDWGPIFPLFTFLVVVLPAGRFVLPVPVPPAARVRAAAVVRPFRPFPSSAG